MHKYRLISKKGEGTFSEVLKAQSIKSGKYVAIKCMKNHFDSIDQVNNLREIQALRRLAGHPNIIKLHEVLYDEPTGRLALVFELMDMNLYEAIKGRRHYLPEQKVKQYIYELLKALDHMHRNGIFHRDVKPENLLLLDDEIKLADLGSCRGIYSRQPYTEYISTRWYRAPECLLTDGYYNFKMDLFAAGCVWFEVVALFPLFPGQNEMDQIQKIHNVLGTPSPELLAQKFKRNASHMDFNFPDKKGTGIERLIPHADADLTELMKKLIRYDPDERILARQALKDPFFRELRDAEKDILAAASPAIHPGSSGGAHNRDPSIGAKPGMSSSSSAASAGDHGEVPEQTPAHEQSGQEEERSGGLPTIRQERRKAGGGNAGGGESEGDGHEDGTVLPPIGGIKGKRDSKKTTGTFKTAGSSALQKQPNVPVHGAAPHASASHGAGPHPLGVLGTSKGFSGTSAGAGTSTSMSSQDAMSSTNPHSWAGTKDQHDIRGVSSGSGQTPVTEKMNSTWAPNHNHNQSRRYVSPFGAKMALGAGNRKR
mmetsp:Transcript_75433/g.161621  ORF Transcript_75433/g.161621 Transcript_75433/m.161621 type:complete len:540 (-) Transcript_75433:80-1699(-)